MRARISVSQACGSTPFILAVMIKLYMEAARRPPRSEPQNNQEFRPRAMPRSDASQASFGGIVGETDSPVLEEESETRPPLQDVVGRLGQVVPTEQLGERSRI